MRNHEGYHDPTAAKAIRRFRKRKGAVKRDTLTYRLDEVPGFRHIQGALADTGATATKRNGFTKQTQMQRKKRIYKTKQMKEGPFRKGAPTSERDSFRKGDILHGRRKTDPDI